jgi:hypothetical protein
MQRATSAYLRHALGVNGQAMVEYIIVLPVLLMLVLGAIQFALLYQIKSTLNYATFIGARQGALKNAKSNSIKDGIASGMTPLFTFSPDVGGLIRGRAIAMVEVFNPLTTKLEVLNPTDKAMTDFGIDDPDGSGVKVIPNDNLFYRCSGDAPCVGTMGSESGISIQDANVLKIRVTYCAKLVIPLANATIYALVNGIEGTKNLATEFFSTAPKAAKTPNRCSQLKDQFGGKVDSVVAAGAAVGADFSFLTSMLQTISDKLAGGTIPILDWGIGGYRIPVVSEAVIRMQSPAKL